LLNLFFLRGLGNEKQGSVATFRVIACAVGNLTPHEIPRTHGMTERNAWNDKKTRAMKASLVSAIDYNALALRIQPVD
jgi:hypothetical protein